MNLLKNKNKKATHFFMGKILSKALIIVLFFMLSPDLVKAQDESNTQAYWIHEDRVKPSMISKYEQISKDLVAACNKHNIQNTQWLTVAQDDNTYLYVTPMKNFSELDVDTFAALGEKMGSENMTKLFSRFNDCYDEHGDYIVYLNKDLSYMPEGITQHTEGKSYRIFYYHHVSPSNNTNFVEALKKIKKVFVNKNSKMHYRVYKTGFGMMGNYYMIVVSAANAEEMAKSSRENWEMMKDQFKPLLTELNKYTLETNEKTGWMRDDLSYIPKK